MKNFNPENWGKIEEKINEAEKKKRQASNASQVLYGETKITKKERGEKEDEEILEKSKRKRVFRKALEREKVFAKEAGEILGDENSPERALGTLRQENLVKALRYSKALDSKKEQLQNEEMEILKGIDGHPKGEEVEALDEIREELKKNKEMKEKLFALNPEAYFGLHLKQIKEYKKELENGKIVETAYPEEKAEEIVKYFLAGQPVFIYGELGGGKSEIAMHVAEKYLKKDPFIISGRKDISPTEFFGHQILTVDEKTNQTISDFYMGPIYQAMEEGRPVIIDEANAIPHEVLISLNHILTRKVGDKINIQQDSGKEVIIKEGFGIMMTGNFNQFQEKYIGRADMDPAFLSRLHKIEYDYLPQSTEGSLSEAGEEDELFHILLADMVDKNGNIEAPKDTIQKLWNLAKSARVIQNVFSGKEINSAFYFQEGAGRATRYLLKEGVLSIRALKNIISQWKAEGFEKELDFYVWNDFIKNVTVASDRAYLYQIMKDQFNFFHSDGWEENPNYGNGGVVSSFDISAPKNKPEMKNFWGPREVVEFAFGKAPERAKWPDTILESEIEDTVNPEMMELEEFSDKLGQEMKNILNEIEEMCKEK